MAQILYCALGTSHSYVQEVISTVHQTQAIPMYRKSSVLCTRHRKSELNFLPVEFCL